LCLEGEKEREGKRRGKKERCLASHRAMAPVIIESDDRLL
jgi:hypothetical protein